MVPYVLLLERDADVEHTMAQLTELGLWGRVLTSAARTSVVVRSDSAALDPAVLRALDGVADVLVPQSPHPLLDAHPEILRVRGLSVGDAGRPVVFAGPCSAEDEAQVFRLAAAAKAAGADFLRGGADKVRTSPYAFRGLGQQALAWLRAAADEHDLGLCTEVVDAAQAAACGAVCDVLQVGARSMHHGPLLDAVGAQKRPVLLKRGFSATVEEWLLAGERLLYAGATGVIFCERGVRGFDPQTRNVLDVGAIALLSHVHRLPVVVDPSHAAGRRDLIGPLLRAGVAAGASGVLVEIHDQPGRARSDGAQALLPSALKDLLVGVSKS